MRVRVWFVVVCISFLSLTAAWGQHSADWLFPNVDEPPDLSGFYVNPGRLEPCGPTINEGYGDDCTYFFHTPQGEAKYKGFDPLRDEPRIRCEPENMPRLVNSSGDMIQIIQEEDVITIKYERSDTTRTIHLNAPAAPAEHPHTDLGYSRGRWMGSTLVVETTHVTDGIFGGEGQPKSEQSYIVERYWRAPDGRNLLVDLVLDDPKYYTRPFMVTRRELMWTDETEMIPWDCTPEGHGI